MVVRKMNIVVLKFGGSSVADNIKLEAVVEKIIKVKQEEKSEVVVIVSAQGKTTDRLIREAQELSAIPNEREMDMLLSTGEQVTAAKLSILLNRKGYQAISLTGWQAGIRTGDVHQSAKIEEIYPKRILDEIQNGNIVIVAGFQGIDNHNDITTLGRGGSDTTAVALAAALGADKCFIYSDVDGIYSTDPNQITIAKKLDEISFEEMQAAADSGAKVLHNRCIQIGQKFNCNIVASSTFSNKPGTLVCQKIENTEVKNIVKNENLIEIHIQASKTLLNNHISIYDLLLKHNVLPECYQVGSNELKFRILKSEQNKVMELLDHVNIEMMIRQEKITKLSIIGFCITQDNIVLNQIIDILQRNSVIIKDISFTQTKIEIIANDISNQIVEKIHQCLIK